MNFRPLPPSHRALPAIGFLAAVQMATPAIAADGKIERKAESVAASASATAHKAGDKAAAAADKAGTKASEALTKANEAVKGSPEKQRWDRSHRVSRIIGTDVRNRKGEKIGDVKDIVLDDKGSIAYAIVSTGGFLGIGDRLHAVPWSALNTHTEKDFAIDLDKASLQKAPGFSSREWPDFSDEQWVSSNRRHYRDWTGAQ